MVFLRAGKQALQELVGSLAAHGIALRRHARHNIRVEPAEATIGFDAETRTRATRCLVGGFGDSILRAPALERSGPAGASVIAMSSPVNDLTKGCVVHAPRSPTHACVQEFLWIDATE